MFLSGWKMVIDENCGSTKLTPVSGLWEEVGVPSETLCGRTCTLIGPTTSWIWTHNLPGVLCLVQMLQICNQNYLHLTVYLKKTWCCCMLQAVSCQNMKRSRKTNLFPKSLSSRFEMEVYLVFALVRCSKRCIWPQNLVKLFLMPKPSQAVQLTLIMHWEWLHMQGETQWCARLKLKNLVWGVKWAPPKYFFIYDLCRRCW